MEKRFTSHRPQAAKAPVPESALKPEGPAKPKVPSEPRPKEIGGPSGPEPTRYGDWERNGICYDF